MYINKTAHTQTIKVVGPNGEKDSINLQPNGRANLPEGFSIDPDFAKQYEAIIKDSNASSAPAAPAPKVIANTPAPAGK